MIDSLQLVSISDFILSALCLFLSGVLFGNIKSYKSRAAILCYFLFFAGLAAFMGGIDHGFFQPINKRYIPRTLTYLFIAAATYFLFKYTIMNFIEGKMARMLIILANIQLIVFVVASFNYHNFLIVVGNYSPILLFFFVMNLLNLKRSKSELDFSLFCLIMIIGTLVQVFEIKFSEMINGDTLYHIIAFIAYIFMFTGVKKIANIKPIKID
jgi:hypothetical protein